MRCVVTGASGYVGAVLVRALSGAGYDVTSLVVRGDEISHIRGFSKIVYGDVCDPGSLDAAFSGADAVLHLAGVVDIGSVRASRMHRVNVTGTANVIAACRNAGVKRLVYMSSVHAIPELPGGQVMGEVSAFDPKKVRGAYAKTKAQATRLVLDANGNGLETVVVQPSGVIGPYGVKLGNIGHVVVDFLCGTLVAYPTGGYNFVDVRDVAQGALAALEKGRAGECYILSGEVVSCERMLRTVADASGKKMLKTRLPYWFVLGASFLAEGYYALLRRPPAITHYAVTTLHSNSNFSSEKAQRELGVRFRPCEESLCDMTRWILQNHVVEREKGVYKRCVFQPIAASAAHTSPTNGPP